MEQPNKYKSLFAQIKSEHKAAGLNSKRDKDSDVLVVDGTNNFIRAWTVVPTLNENGEHIGGITGFLLSLGHAIKMLRPTRVVIVFDGKGGSLRRRQLYPEYKANRKMTVRVNRAYEDMSTPENEQQQMLQQMQQLIFLLRELPVSIVCIDNIEADDAIAYVATQMFPTGRVTIMSGDKDFLQLVSTRVQVWSPVKKKLYGVQDIINEYEGIHPTNFIYYRILEGDKGDNINGIKGIALKTALKLFPALKEESEYSVEKILLHSRDGHNEKKGYASILENSDIVARNFELMQLKTPSFSPSLQLQVAESVNKINELNKIQLIQSMTKFHMHQSISNFHVWIQEVFWPLSVFAKS